MTNESTFARDTIVGYFKSGQPIRRAELQPGSLFLECNFEEANFNAEVISKCNFRNCNFQYATLKSARFANCSFSECNLNNINAEDAFFESCAFSSTTLKNSFLSNTQILSMDGSIEFHGSKIQGLSITQGNQGLFTPQFKLIGEPNLVPEGYFIVQDPWTTFSGQRKCYLNVSYNRIVNDVVLQSEQKLSFRVKSKLRYVGW